MAAACASFTAESPPAGADGGANANASDSGGSSDAGDAAATDEGGKVRDGYRANVLADGPIGYWRLDDSPGTTKAHDETKMHDGTYVGTCTLGVPGALPNETAVHFDGKSCTVDLGANFGFPSRASFSIEALVKTDATATGYGHIFSKQLRVSDAPVDGYALLFDSPISTYAERAVNSDNRITSPAAFPKAVFTHLIATYDGATLDVYVDGQPVGSGGDTTPMAQLTAHALIGSAGTTNFFKGDIDEVAIYDKALTPDRIAAHAAASK